MKHYLTITTFLGGFLLLTAFVWQEFSPEVDKSTFEEFSALFPEAEFPIVADSTFLQQACEKKKKIDKNKFKKFIDFTNRQVWFSRSPIERKYYAIAKINQTDKYTAFAYLKSEYVSLGNYNNLGLHILTFNKKGKRIDDVTVAKLTWEGRDKYYKLVSQVEATLLAEPLTDKLWSRLDPKQQKVVNISKKGVVVYKPYPR